MHKSSCSLPAFLTARASRLNPEAIRHDANIRASSEAGLGRRSGSVLSFAIPRIYC
jgi:hypothetical protein